MGGLGEACALDAMDVDVAGIDAQLAFVLSYDGAPFSGFARQPGRLTVQGELERALSMALRRPVEVVCAGRTDAGVHARAQVVSLPVTRAEAQGRNLAKLKRSVQAITDDAIAIQSVSLMPPEFSARFSAVEREYRYLIMPGGRHPLFLRDWCWDVRRDLDVAAMNRAAAHLEGEHDFKSFCLAASAKGKNTVRALREVRVLPVNVMGEEALSVRVTGTAFLHSMVRSIVGTLVLVGAGLREPDWVADVLAARDRQAAGENAPAKGLVFWRVGYRGGLPCYGHDAIAPEEGGYVIPPDGASHIIRAAKADAPGTVTEQDVAAAEAFADALERAEPDDPAAAEDVPAADAAPVGTGDAAEIPAAVAAAASTRKAGSVRVNDVGGKPAIPAAPRTRHIAPADPQPAEGEVSIVLGGRRRPPAAPAGESAGKAAGGRANGKPGLFSRLFGGPDGGKAGGHDA